ncbi:MAG: phosphotransferase [SAR202 cluster bacterium]|jgi:hypothetical protein|nr:phosphotransferase [SAR202 cluster bacterium]MDP6511852.1 phosphotransferase [SAR202 cluster bacterium]MDP6715064.1 phosphotransferase [SAR202 cluster bacterium]
MTLLPLPASLDEITPSWLTRALAPQLASENVNVTGVESETIAEGVGFAGGLGRLTIEYDLESTSAPKTLIAKMPSSHEQTRNLLTTLGVYEREVRFYQSVASEIPMRSPKCFVAHWDSQSKRFILLLEDLGALRFPDQSAGCSVEDAELVVTDLAKLHASMWNNPLLKEWAWAPAWDAGADLFAASFPMWWGKFQEDFSDAIPDDFQKMADMVAPRVAAIKTRLAQRPVTLCHGDFRLANMFFEDPPSGNSLTVFDWQAMRIGRAPYDLAYFLAGSMTVEDRSAHQERLKSRYHEGLVQAGVTDYSEIDFEEDFGYGLLDLVSFTAMVGGNLSFEGEEAQQFIDGAIVRVADALSDVDTERLIANLG